MKKRVFIRRLLQTVLLIMILKQEVVQAGQTWLVVKRFENRLIGYKLDH